MSSYIDRMADAKAEIDRLRAENAELWTALTDVTDALASLHPAWEVVEKARAILAKTAKEDQQ